MTLTGNSGRRIRPVNPGRNSSSGHLILPVRPLPIDDPFFLYLEVCDAGSDLREGIGGRTHLARLSEHAMSTVRYTALTPNRFKNFWKD
jgi:hypothetical protein